MSQQSSSILSLPPSPSSSLPQPRPHYNATPYAAYRTDKSHYLNFAVEIGEICSCYVEICPVSESGLDALDEVCRFWVSQLFEKAAAAQCSCQGKSADRDLQPRSFGAFLAPAQLLRMEQLMNFFKSKSSLRAKPLRSEEEEEEEEEKGSNNSSGDTNEPAKKKAKRKKSETGREKEEEKNENEWSGQLDDKVWAESTRRTAAEQGEALAYLDREVLGLRVALERDERLGRRSQVDDTRVVSFVRPTRRRYKKFRAWAGVGALQCRVSNVLCEVAAQLLLEWLERIAHGTRVSTPGLPADEPLTASHVKAYVMSLGLSWVCPPPLFA